MSPVRKFIEWLSYHPTADEIARALVSEYLAGEKVSRIRLCRIQSDDSAMVLGQYGYLHSEEWPTASFPGSQWRAFDKPEFDIVTGRNKNSWAPNSQMCVITLRDHGLIHGFIVFEFMQEITDKDKARVKDEIEDFSMPIALYLSLQLRQNSLLTTVNPSSSELHDVSNAQLSQRQILILQGMVEGKTNHELATDMGFSVSTIRHETMRIYQALAVSDRKEAAKKALELSLI